MSTMGQMERVTQAWGIALLRDELDYCYLGNWSKEDAEPIAGSA